MGKFWKWQPNHQPDEVIVTYMIGTCCPIWLWHFMIIYVWWLNHVETVETPSDTSDHVKAPNLVDDVESQSPNGGFLKWGYPQIIHLFLWIFVYISQPASWGIPPWKPPTLPPNSPAPRCWVPNPIAEAFAPPNSAAVFDAVPWIGREVESKTDIFLTERLQHCNNEVTPTIMRNLRI